MADPRTARANAADLSAVSLEATTVASGPDWESEDAYWQSAYPERSYARADRGYEYYRSAYRFGFDAAMRWQGRPWQDAEAELRRLWSTSDDASQTPWVEMRNAVRDAWDHVRGESRDDRTHIR